MLFRNGSRIRSTDLRRSCPHAQKRRRAQVLIGVVLTQAASVHSWVLNWEDEMPCSVSSTMINETAQAMMAHEKAQAKAEAKTKTKKKS